MLHLSALLLALFTVVFAQGPCTCPPADNAFYPLGTGGPTNNVLHCTYPPLSRCEYSTADGSLTKDSNSGLCPTSAPGQTCPAADLGEFPLGPGSGAHGTTLYCTYPSQSEATNTDFFCVYSLTDGSLTADGNDNFCPTNAQCGGAPAASGSGSAASGSAARSTSIDPAVSAGHPTSRSTVRVLSTPPLPSTPGASAAASARTTTSGGAAQASQSAQSQSGSARTVQSGTVLALVMSLLSMWLA